MKPARVVTVDRTEPAPREGVELVWHDEGDARHTRRVVEILRAIRDAHRARKG